MTDLMWCKQRHSVVGIIACDAAIQPGSEWSRSCLQQNLALTFTLAARRPAVVCGPLGLASELLGQAWTRSQSVTTRVEKGHISWSDSRGSFTTSAVRAYTNTHTHIRATSLVSTLCPLWQVATLWPCGVWLNLLGQLVFTGHWHLFQNSHHEHQLLQ